MIQCLAQDGHDIKVVSFAEPQDINSDLSPLRKLCSAVELVPVPGPSNGNNDLIRRFFSLASPSPYAVNKFRSQPFRDLLSRHLARQSFDLIICDGIYNAQNLPASLPAPVLLNKDDVAYVILRRYLALEHNLARRAYVALEAAKVHRWERSVCQRMTRLLACSPIDRDVLQPLCPDVPISIVPNVVDVNHYKPAGDGEPLTVVFQGGMDWHPNRDAVEYFTSQMLPELHRLVPGVVFRVAGRSATEEFRRQFDSSSSVEFTGTVADMRNEIAKAAVCVVPLRIGSGTRLKILEAAAMAKPIISTRLGAEGLEFVDGEEIILEDQPQAFAEAVATLLHDKTRRKRLGVAARQRMEHQYSLSTLQAAVRTALNKVGSSLDTVQMTQTKYC